MSEVDPLPAPSAWRSTSSRYADYIAARNLATRTSCSGAGRGSQTPPNNDDAEVLAVGVSSTARRQLAQYLRLHLRDGKLGARQVIAAAALNEPRPPLCVGSYVQRL